MKRLIKRTGLWPWLLLLTDAAFIFVTWIIRQEALPYLLLFLLLFTLLIFAAGFFGEISRQKKDERALLHFLSQPNDQTREALLQRFDGSEAIRALCSQFLYELSLVNEKTMELAEYREYIEAWVHEAKTPLSLSALLLGNHREEMSPYVYTRWSYIHHQLNEDVERILYYARLQTDHPDTHFTEFSFDGCLLETLEEYEALIKEKGISLSLDLQPARVVSDRKIVSFILSQLISNAVKYSDEQHGKISCVIGQAEDKIFLHIADNGRGVPPEDSPFLFDKGFTGSQPNRQKATGMGLYLARKYADAICLEISLSPEIPFEKGFGIECIFSL